MADQDETPKISLKQRLINFKNCITVEPVVAAWIIPACILIIATENLNLEKVFIFYISSCSTLRSRLKFSNT